jgi:predicted flap endonuclease-1-like 5' DNA nuclease
MELRSLWFLLAGFILGFAISSLWEWLYFRQVRWRALGQAMAKDSAMPTQPNNSAIPQEPDRDVGIWSEPAYRSPGVLLEGEQPDEPSVGSLHFEQAVHEDDNWPRRRPAQFVASEAPTKPPATERLPGAQPSEAPHVRPIPNMVVTSTIEQPRVNIDAQASYAVPPSAVQTTTTPTVVYPNTTLPRSPITIQSPSPLVSIAQPTAHGLDKADDFTKIKGIGETYQERLHAAGIRTWAQLATAEPEALRAITKAMFKSQIADWKVQAAAFAQAESSSA